MGPHGPPPRLPRLRLSWRRCLLLLVVLLSSSLSGRVCPSSVSGAATQVTSNVSSVRLDFSDSSATMRLPLTTVALAHPGQVKDRWAPQVGPASMVPTDCDPSGALGGCVGGVGKFASLLAASRRRGFARNETTLLLLGGDWLSGDSFARSGHGVYEADYLYLLGCDAVGLAAYEFQIALGANWTIFLEQLRSDFAGNGVAGGVADLRTITSNGTEKHISRRRLLSSAEGTTQLLRAHRFETESVSVASSPTTNFPLLLTNVRVRDVGVSSSSTFSVLDDFAATLPNIQGSVILDYGFDWRAMRDRLCSDDTDSCTNSATGGYGDALEIEEAAADGVPESVTAAAEYAADTRIGVLTWTTDDLTEITSIPKLFPTLASRIYQDTEHSSDLLQKEVSALLDSGVNKVVVLATATMGTTFQTLLKSVVGIDIVLYQSEAIYPAYFSSETMSGAPILFVGCSSFLLHYCVTEVTFDANGVLLAATVNSTLLDDTVDGTNTRVNQVVAEDYSAIFTNASTTVVGSKLYAPTYGSDTSRVRFFETDDGDAVADSGRWIGRTQLGFANSGSIRAVLAQGDVTLTEVQSLLPFEDVWVRINVTGSLLWSSLENSVSLSSVSDPTDPLYSTSGRGKFMQVSGMRFVWNPTGADGHKITSVSIENTSPSTSDDFDAEFNLDTRTPSSNDAEQALLLSSLTFTALDPDAWYSLTVTSFAASNGDGYEFLDNAEALVLDDDLDTFQVVFQSYLDAVTPLKVTADERIVRNETRFAPYLTSVTPDTGDLTQTTNIRLTGYHLFTGADASGTTVRLRAPPPLVFNIECKVVATPIAVSTSSPPLQTIQCAATPPTDADTSVTAVRILIDSGVNGAASFTSLSPAWFNFTAGSASETCALYDGTLWRSSKCQCRAGYYLLNDTTDDDGGPCGICGPGTYSLDESSACTPCAAGTYSTANGSTSCTTCAANTFSSSSGAITCDPCPTNSVTDLNLLPARTRCFCSAGYIHDEDLRRLIERARGGTIDYAAFSTDMPANQNSTSDASYGPATFYANNFTCTACLNGGVCDPIAGDMRVTYGRWFDAESASFLTCPNEDNCCPIGEALPSGTNFPSDAAASCSFMTGSDSACDAHREGFVCASCTSGYQNQLRSILAGASSSANDAAVSTIDASPTVCVKCETPNGGLIVALGVVALLYLAFVLFNTPGASDYTKILIDYAQMCALVLLPGMLSGGYGDASYLQIFHMRVDIMVGSADSGGTCIVPVSSLANMVLHALIGPMLLAALGVIFVVCWTATGCNKGLSRFPWWRFRMAGWQLVLFGFMGTISGAFNLLHCESVGGRLILVESPDVECWTGAHTVVAIIAICVVVTLCLIVPCGIVVFVRRLRLRLKSAYLFEQIRATEEEEGARAGDKTVGVPQLHLHIQTLHRRAASSAGDTSTSSAAFRHESSFSSRDASPVSSSCTSPKLDMERVARRIYRKSSIVAVVRRRRAMLRQQRTAPIAKHTDLKRAADSALAASVASSPPSLQPPSPLPASQRVRVLFPGAEAATGLDDMLYASEEEKSPKDAQSPRSLDDFANPLARFRHYAATSTSRAKITDDELLRDEGVHLTPFERLLLSHGILFLAYKRGWRWFEGAFLIRRVLFALPFAVTGQDTAIVIVGWYCTGIFMFHSLYDVFAMQSTHRLHSASLVCIISLCWLQSSSAFNGTWVHVVAWLLVLAPFIIGAMTHPLLRGCRRACERCCCCGGSCADRCTVVARRAREDEHVHQKAKKRVARAKHARDDAANAAAAVASEEHGTRSKIHSRSAKREEVAPAETMAAISPLATPSEGPVATASRSSTTAAHWHRRLPQSNCPAPSPATMHRSLTRDVPSVSVPRLPRVAEKPQTPPQSPPAPPPSQPQPQSQPQFQSIEAPLILVGGTAAVRTPFQPPTPHADSRARLILHLDPITESAPPAATRMPSIAHASSTDGSVAPLSPGAPVVVSPTGADVSVRPQRIRLRVTPAARATSALATAPPRQLHSPTPEEGLLATETVQL